MKSQMKFQKILTLVSLIVGALVFVNALIFFTGNLAEILQYSSPYLAGSIYSIRYDSTVADGFVDAGQMYVSIMVVLAIILICSVVFMYITSTNSRRKYYVTNYVAIGIYLAAALAVVAVGFAMLAYTLSEFTAMDWDTLNAILKDREANEALEFGRSTTTFIIGFAVYAIVLINLVAWVLNLVWKVKLMQGEKKLLEGVPAKEVA